jgi:hypothetical protein
VLLHPARLSAAGALPPGVGGSNAHWSSNAAKGNRPPRPSLLNATEVEDILAKIRSIKAMFETAISVVKHHAERQNQLTSGSAPAEL